MAAKLTLRWPLSWIADVVNTIGPLFIGLLDCKARTAETNLAWPRRSRSGRDDFISAETLLLTLHRYATFSKSRAMENKVKALEQQNQDLKGEVDQLKEQMTQMFQLLSSSNVAITTMAG
ncbi:hypothetical protein CR513_04006, partial [Mucuna pruriens]